MCIRDSSTAVTTVTSTDVDAGATLTYSISGADAALFTVDASTGVLSFIAAPSYESPGDAGGNNVYDVTVQVSDGSLTDTQAIAVTVTNVNAVSYTHLDVYKRQVRTRPRSRSTARRVCSRSSAPGITRVRPMSGRTMSMT